MNRPESATPLSVFTVEDTAAQLTWGSLPEGRLRVHAGDASVVVGGAGPGAALLTGLPPGADLDLVAESDDGTTRWLGPLRTLTPPPGRELFRFATVNDIHLGDPRFGRLPMVSHPDDGAGGPPPPERCLRAAVAELAAWGAQLIVAKGDITDHGSVEEWETAAKVLSAPGVPVEAMLGNHDVCRGAVDGTDILAGAGITLSSGAPQARDLPGVRLVVTDTTVAGKNRGTGLRLGDVAPLVAEAEGPAVVALHHHPQRHRTMTHPPRGIPGNEAMPFLDAVAEANPATLVIAGHSHRHRRHRWGPLTVAEVGSPQDYPGTWAGYVVHEGGIRQVVRRVADPDAIAWTESTRDCFLGLWGRWSPGTRDQRCFSLTWPRR
ncbi:MAG: metallophosphoesterase [Actinomycetota bacterium]|nr:metallophosphoesterase [Actinomycetota bacterium]